jgi:hypothetical protein
VKKNLPSENTISPKKVVGISIGVSFLSVIASYFWAKYSVSHFQDIAGQQSLAGLENESVAHMWGISLPFFVGTALICVVSCWMLIVLIRRKSTKLWLLGLLPHGIAFLALCWQMVGLEFDAFN